MKKSILSKAFAFCMIALMISPMLTNAQVTDAEPLRRFTLNVNAGVTTPFTDVRNYDWARITDPKSEYQYGVGLGAHYMLNSVFGLQGNFFYGKIQGVVRKFTDVEEQSETWTLLTQNIETRDGNPVSTSFYSATDKFMQGDLRLYINITNIFYNLQKAIKTKNGTEEFKERRVGLYASGGLGLSYFNAKVYNANTDDDLQGKYLKGSSGDVFETVVPVSLGVKFNLHPMLDLGLENTFVFVNTDKLDGVESTLRGRNDRYNYTALTIGIKIGGKKKSKDHLEWVHPSMAVDRDLQRQIDEIGLLPDSDGDGVPDPWDKDPDTPEGVTVDGSGQPLDVDQDGIPDYLDEELFTDKNAPVDETGKSKDTDGDGVPDHLDKEPNTPPNTMVNFQGQDISNLGGSLAGVPVNGLPAIFFDLNRSEIKNESHVRLFVVGKYMKENPDVKIKLVGNTDTRGSETYNSSLGQNRSDAVAKYLVENYDIDASRIQTESDGESKPVAKIHLSNRRVDVLVVE